MSDRELIRITSGFTKGILNKRESKSMCFAVSFPLQGYLSFCGLEAEIIEGEIKLNKEVWNHFWLRLPDGRILDPTANQFKTPDGKEMPKIFIGNKPEWYKVVTK
jgi:hypothetical protein